jgi:hypothetical protein
MIMPIPSLPESPPPLHDILTLDDRQRGRAHLVIDALSESLNDLPVVLCQGGEVVAYAGRADDDSATRIARLSDRLWNDGATTPAHEFIHFEEESLPHEEERMNVMLYAAHIKGGLTLTAGWELALSLTQMRAEVGDAKTELLQILEE